MQLWSVEIKELELLITSVKSRLPELEKDLEHLLKTNDENVVLLYARRCLEIIITDLCERELKRPRKTEPLRGIIDKLNREEKVPSNIITSMDHLNSLSTFGTHPKDFDPEQVKPVLNNLAVIIRWYLKYKDTQTISKVRSEEPEHESKVSSDVIKVIHKPGKKFVFLLAAFLLVVVIVVISLFLFNIIGGGKQTGELEKSIAILPFKNDSPDEENVYFLNGIMEEILNNLQTIKDLRVISRTSVEQYRNSDKSIPEIAKDLGVNYIVEGSGQKYGSRFSLSIQLIKATVKETHLWAKSYEQEIKEVKDIFDIKRQVAQAITSELKAVITPQEDVLIQQIPTDNPLAYDYFIRGWQYKLELNWDSAIQMYSKAVEQDPEFISAYLARASLYSVIYFQKGEYYKGSWKGFDSLAKADLGIAMKINPDLPNVKYTQAEQLYWIDQNYDKALEVLNLVKDQMPNNPDAVFIRGCVLRRRGQWEESIKDFQQAILLDPLDPFDYFELGNTYRIIRKYPEALEFYDKPKFFGLNYSDPDSKFITILLWKGDLEEALKISDTSITYLGSSADLEYSNYFYYSRDYEKLIPVADKFENQFDYFPKTLILAQIYFLNGNIVLSRQYADSAISELIPKVEEYPEDERYFAALGYAYAFRGHKNKAIENARKAVKLKQLEQDALQGQVKEMDLANIYILTGEYDLAMDKIEFLLTIPGEISVPFLKINPIYDKLRPLPRFQKILATEYKTKY